MNANDFYKTLFEDRLGLDVLGLNDYYRDLIELIHRTTIPFYSTLINHIYIYRMDLEDKSKLLKEEFDRKGKEYKISDETLDLLGVKILGISGYEIPTEDFSYDNGILATASYDSWSVMIGSEQTLTDSMIQSALPFKKDYYLVGDDVVKLVFFPDNGQVNLNLNIEFPNIAAIPEEFKESLLQLAELDVMVRLYNEFKHLDSVVTAMGNLDTKMSNWESAASTRLDFIKELRRQTFPDRMVASGYYIVL